jgi:hypothetical protein
VAGSEALYQWPTIALRPGEQWEVTAVLPADLPNSVPVEAVLYRADAPETSYRRVALWRGGSE